jgi:hypothetical protein
LVQIELSSALDFAVQDWHGYGLIVTTPALEIGGRKLRIVPATVLRLGPVRFPFGGGFHFRGLPFWTTRICTHLVNPESRPVLFYLHTREIDPDQPRLPLAPVDRFVTYVNLGNTLAKLKRLLAIFATISIEG